MIIGEISGCHVHDIDREAIGSCLHMEDMGTCALNKVASQHNEFSTAGY